MRLPATAVDTEPTTSDASACSFSACGSPSKRRAEFVKPIYQVEAYVTRTGTKESYAPKGAWTNPQKRLWKKYEPWQPPK